MRRLGLNHFHNSFNDYAVSRLLLTMSADC
jgi:hypothetical protein